MTRLRRDSVKTRRQRLAMSNRRRNIALLIDLMQAVERRDRERETVSKSSVAWTLVELTL